MPSVCHVTHFCQDKNMFLQCMAVFDVQKLSNKSKKKVKEVFPNLEGRDVCKREAEKLCDL